MACLLFNKYLYKYLLFFLYIYIFATHNVYYALLCSV